MEKDKIQYICAAEAQQAFIDGACLLDVRQKQEVEDRWIDVPQRLSIPLTDLPDRLDALPTSQTFIICCILGIQSRIAAQLLQDNGFERVFVLKDGLLGWQTAGCPVQSKKMVCCKCMCKA
jgi:rhodanese-related sulfurtransferase